MIPLHSISILRQRLLCNPHALSTIRPSCSPFLARPRAFVSPPPQQQQPRLDSSPWRRSTSTIASNPPPSTKPQIYRERINVYRAGTSATLVVGLGRLSAIAVFMMGVGIVAPRFYFSPDHTNWWIPAVLVGALIPALTIHLATGPMVHAIQVILPETARKSKEDLKKFSQNSPRDTTLELQFMRWAPWPTTRRVRFDRLRRLQPSFSGGIANLEHLPGDTGNKQGKQSFLGDIVKSWANRFFVNKGQNQDRSAVPGVWDGMWCQIPFKGSEWKPQNPESKIREPNRRVAKSVMPVAPPPLTRRRPSVSS
jgi:hypothetical protein